MRETERTCAGWMGVRVARCCLAEVGSAAGGGSILWVLSTCNRMFGTPGTQEIEALRGDLSRMAVAEEAARVTVRAADDRARAAELVCLDVRRQCDQAARTIGRLIDENSDLVAKINSQANALEGKYCSA